MMQRYAGIITSILFTILGSSSMVHAQSYDAAPDFYEINEDVPDVTMDVMANDLNTTGVTDVYLNIATLPLHGTVTVDAVNDLLIYSPNDDYYGTDNFEYTGCANTDPDICGTTSVIITINPVPDKPIAVDDAVETYVNTPLNIEPLLNDIDVDNEGLEFTIIDDADYGATTIIFGEAVFYEPFPCVYGEDCFIYKICKIGSDIYCDTATVCVDVQTTNFNPPSALNDTATVVVIDTIDIPVLLNDFDGDGDAMIVSEIIADGMTGTATINADNTIKYIPFVVGTDDFRYVVCDNNCPPYCDTAYVHMKIEEPEIPAEAIHVPNSFSPNGDGINDMLTIEGLESGIKYNVNIYDRNSSLVFEKEKLATSDVWDGTSNVEFISSSGNVPEGTYFYVIRIEGLPDPLSGFIVVKR